MAVEQPDHLHVMNETSGTAITQYGTADAGYSVQQGTSPTNWEWHQGAGPYTNNGYFESKTRTTANMPYLATSATTPGVGFQNLGLMIAFYITDYNAATGGILVAPNGASVIGDVLVTVGAPGGSGDFDLICQFSHSGSGSISNTFSALAYSTNYILSMSLDVSTVSAVQARFKLGAGSVQTPATQDWTSYGLLDSWPRILRRQDFTDELGIIGRINAFAYTRGGTLWSATDLGDINSNPATAITGWPSGGGGPAGQAVRTAFLGLLRANN